MSYDDFKSILTAVALVGFVVCVLWEMLKAKDAYTEEEDQ